MRGRKNLYSDFYCTHCGNFVMTLPRPLGHQRAGGHLKNLYCPHCRTEYNCVEVPEKGQYTKECFLYEFNCNNFTESGLRKENLIK